MVGRHCNGQDKNFSDDLADKTETIVHETFDVTSHDSGNLL